MRYINMRILFEQSTWNWEMKFPRTEQLGFRSLSWFTNGRQSNSKPKFGCQYSWILWKPIHKAINSACSADTISTKGEQNHNWRRYPGRRHPYWTKPFSGRLRIYLWLSWITFHLLKSHEQIQVSVNQPRWGSKGISKNHLKKLFQEDEVASSSKRINKFNQTILAKSHQMKKMKIIFMWMSTSPQ